LASLPAGTDATLVKSVGRGTGDMTLELDAVLPSSSKASIRVQQIVVLESAGSKIRVSQTLASKVSISTS
jgi:hypothetical protein